MPSLQSIPPFEHLVYEKTSLHGAPLDVLVARATFDLGSAGRPMRLAEKQTPLVWGEEYAGPVEENPLRAVISRDGDLAPIKQGTDILVYGSLHSPDGRAQPDWFAGVRVGDIVKTLRITGPRKFKRGLFGWKLTSPDPIESIQLDYRQSFGGAIDLANGPNQPAASCRYAANPAGCGWLPKAHEFDRKPRPERKRLLDWMDSLSEICAPQFESPLRLISHPHDRHPPEGFGPIPRWWSARSKLQGTLDARWRAERYPLVPLDFNVRYNNGAHPDLISPTALLGNEPLVLAGCYPEGMLSTALPDWTVYVMCTFESGKRDAIRLDLDTVSVDLDARQSALIWRTVFARHDPLKEALLSACPSAHWPGIKVKVDAAFAPIPTPAPLRTYINAGAANG